MCLEIVDVGPNPRGERPERLAPEVVQFVFRCAVRPRPILRIAQNDCAWAVSGAENGNIDIVAKFWHQATVNIGALQE
ncbi:hypothetical protein AFL01nite_04810 [Aeromicrobium flavum]|uniref:Uncharacterized protein n=1 Tax=Aeromicrobium flavum TaxID=416568 RepID=A0A512HRS8_9ACTN|nr:hypothetical protein AFL01nite_04810 [Aeromicrobium flavum]